MCKKLHIAEHIDRCVPKTSDDWKVYHGEAVVTMIINRLGFTGQSLHMFPQCFANKPLDKLIIYEIQLRNLSLTNHSGSLIAGNHFSH